LLQAKSGCIIERAELDDGNHADIIEKLGS